MRPRRTIQCAIAASGAEQRQKAQVNLRAVRTSVCRADFGTRAIPTKHLFLGVDLFEHVIHVLVVCMVKVPNGLVFRVFLKGHRVGVGDIHSSFEHLSQQDTNDSLVGVFCNPVVMIDDAQQHERVHHHLVDGEVLMQEK